MDRNLENLDNLDFNNIQIKRSNQLLILCSSDSNNIYLVDPKTSCILQTYVDENPIGLLSISHKFGHMVASH
jgi:hypothetical protein